MVVSDNDVLLLTRCHKIMFLSAFLKLPFQLSAAAYVCASASVFKAMKQERFGGKPRTHGGEKIVKAYRKQGGRYQPANQVETSCGRAQETFKEVLLTSQKAGQIRQITTLGESISHIPECPALESGLTLESQVSWLK